jgi:lactoylglutathione lyase
MLDIKALDHLGIRISDREIAVPFYENLGFAFVAGAAFDQGHPIVMRHPSGLVVNLLGPANAGQGDNILMDKADKYPGITHFAIKVRSIEATEVFLKEASIPITSRRHFMGVSSVFIHDPDNTVIEIVGEGPDVADLILAYEASQKEGAK